MLTPMGLSVGPVSTTWVPEMLPRVGGVVDHRRRRPGLRRPVGARAGPEHRAPGRRIGAPRHDEVGAAERQLRDAPADLRSTSNTTSPDVNWYLFPTLVGVMGRSARFRHARLRRRRPLPARPPRPARPPTPPGPPESPPRPPAVSPPFPAGPPPGPAPAGPRPLPAAAAPATPVVPPPPVIPPEAPPWLAAPPAPASPSLLLPGWEQATERQAMARRQFNLVMRGGTFAEIDGHRVLATPAWLTRLATQRGVRSGRRARERATFIGTVDERPVGGAQIALPGRAPFESKKAGQRLSR